MDNSQIQSTFQQSNIIQTTRQNIVLWGIDMASSDQRAELIELLNSLPLIKKLHREYLLQELCQITSEHLMVILDAARATTNPDKAVRMCKLNRFEQKSSLLAKSYYSELFRQCKSKAQYQTNMEWAYSKFVKEMINHYNTYLTESHVSKEESEAFRFYSKLQEQATSFFIESKRFKIHDIDAEMIELTRQSQRSRNKRDPQPPKVKRRVGSSLMKLPGKHKK